METHLTFSIVFFYTVEATELPKSLDIFTLDTYVTFRMSVEVHPGKVWPHK
jgi:hypothetical protein